MRRLARDLISGALIFVAAAVAILAVSYLLRFFVALALLFAALILVIVRG